MERRTSEQPTGNRSLALTAVLAIVAAVVVNLLIFAVGNAVASDPVVDPMSGDDLPVPAIIASTTIGIAVGALVYWLVTRKLNKPESLFLVIAGIFLAISIMPVVTSSERNGTTVIALLLMHLSTAAIAVGALTGRLRLGR